MKRVYITGAARTPIGKFGGTLKDVSPVELGSTAIKEALKRSNIDGSSIDEVFFGCVLQAGQGQNVARQCSIKSGIDVTCPATTLNMVCGSGLKSVSLGASSIMVGDNDIVVVGGTENMSSSAYVLSDMRNGARLGHKSVTDTMIKDGLWDAFNDYHMGITSENLAEKYNISREEQDKFALGSQIKAATAQSEGRFCDEIVPVEIVARKKTIVFDKDEYIRADATIESMQKLRPAFKENGSVTAANSSGINDGSAALVLMSEGAVAQNDIKPLGEIKAYASYGVDPSIMGIGPAGAVKRALKKANLMLDDISLLELNEAFSAQSLAVLKELKIDSDKVNVNGGAIALGHPIGSSGARILVTLLYEMQRRDVKYGVASLCVGGGMGVAVVVER